MQIQAQSNECRFLLIRVYLALKRRIEYSRALFLLHTLSVISDLTDELILVVDVHVKDADLNLSARRSGNRILHQIEKNPLHSLLIEHHVV